jgi:hypothetical protein
LDPRRVLSLKEARWDVASAAFNSPPSVGSEEDEDEEEWKANNPDFDSIKLDDAYYKELGMDKAWLDELNQFSATDIGALTCMHNAASQDINFLGL